MAKTAKNNLDKQSATIGRFQTILRSEEARIREGEPNFIESLMEKSAEKNQAWQNRLAQKGEQKRISHYRPENPVNAFYMMSKEEQRQTQKRLKSVTTPVSE